MGSAAPRASRRLALAAGLALPAAACTTLERGPAVPRALQEAVTVLGIPNARFWADTQADRFGEEAVASLEREARHLGVPVARLPPAALLAISGGSDNGAFGAGLLTGWTERGDRPVFKLVTGISTGSLSAPLAFLGPSQDARLREAYTEIGPEDVLRQHDWSVIPFRDAIADSSPLFRLISRYLDAAMLAEIGVEYAKGRSLLIGSANLDAQRPVIWNIGAIAASGHPGALDLARRILLASASVPGAFPPVLIEVEAGGRRWQELHVDGGAMAQTFLYPVGLGTRAIRREAPRRRDAYVIRNARLGGEDAETKRNLLSIAGRAISTMIAYGGQNDILRLQNLAQRDGVGFHLAYIGDDFTLPWTTPFERSYMRALFAYGRTRMLEGRAWLGSHPVLDRSG